MIRKIAYLHTQVGGIDHGLVDSFRMQWGAWGPFLRGADGRMAA